MTTTNTGQPCKRCKAENAQYKMRNLATCKYVHSLEPPTALVHAFNLE